VQPSTRVEQPLRWAVVLAALDPAIGHEQAGARRALVVSYEPFHRSGLMTVCPITAARSDARYPGDVPIPVWVAGQTKPGVILCQHLRTISAERIVRDEYTGGIVLHYLSDPVLRAAVRRAIAHHLSLDIPAVSDDAVG
jgi:mRNA-degrading endonuclease toxin of MazEF toxin-antitoxin module